MLHLKTLLLCSLFFIQITSYSYRQNSRVRISTIKNGPVNNFQLKDVNS